MTMTLTLSKTSAETVVEFVFETDTCFLTYAYSGHPSPVEEIDADEAMVEVRRLLTCGYIISNVEMF